MTTVSAASERLDYLLLADGAPARCIGDLLDRVVQLRSELDDIQRFLEALGTTSNNTTADLFKKVATELAYDIEDVVESYARKETISKRKSGVIRFFLTGFIRRSLQKDLNIFRRRINRLKDSMGGILTPAQTDAAKEPRRREQLVLETTRENCAHIVGMEEDISTLKDLLISEEPSLSIIAICGMGGAGKTTLAKWLYNDPSLVSHFVCRGWVVVSQEFQAKEFLKTILISLSLAQSKDEMTNMETTQLMEELYKFVTGRRYLVVLDDVWSTEAWDTIKSSFPDNHNGSRVVITTRNRNVVEQITRSSIHQMRMLTDAQSWELLRIKSGVHDLGMNSINQVIRQCGGHPLAVTVIGNILRVTKLKDWDVVLHDLQKNPNLGAVEEILDLSYKQLPLHLKPCFLHLGQFPPNQDIPVHKLYSMWMAEGLISTRDVNNKSRMEVAESYLTELVDRNMVIVVQREEVQFKSCQLHELMRDLCLLKVKQEQFFEVIDFGLENKISSLTRRFAIYLNKFKNTNDILRNIPEAKHIRSILFFDTHESQPEPMWPIDLMRFRWTRMLDFDGVDFQVKTLPRGMEKLIYLRYLSFQGCYLQEFPSYLSNLFFLETLDLRVSCIMTIPNVLRKLSSLRHLYFPLAYQSAKRDKLKLNGLINLEILENFHFGICDADDLLQLKKLQIFTGTVDGVNVDLKSTTVFINGSKSLRHSSLVVKNFDSYSRKRLEIVVELFKCNALHFLDIEGYLGKLPLYNAIGSSFTELVFNGSEFNEDPMPILGVLPNLRRLVLCNNAFVGKQMVCSESDFLRLTSLELLMLRSLEIWNVELGALPSLTILTIGQCHKLLMLPDGLMTIPTLQKLMIGSMSCIFLLKVTCITEKRKSINSRDRLNVSYYE